MPRSQWSSQVRVAATAPAPKKVELSLGSALSACTGWRLVHSEKGHRLASRAAQ
ncbi:hypothetical protein H6F86_26060 [Phormidium sp. FACHB-592]|uniref:Uncharacterized protein n=1 Tax=Stenomitos frigidus AS-A4 TaxID=2933935 RepID=A0ABV0KU33_9CYAN|nr:hypothetical protein [Phormidium sp. FACHB-592]MBD2077281.1 hypothetical protein [Phormidium sp. FACHB-592]